MLVKCTQYINYEISNNKSKIFLNLIKLNLFGSIYPKNSKSRYFITCLNKYSKYLDVKFLRLKSISEDTFIEYVIKEQRQFDKKLKVFREDNALKFNDINNLYI